MGSRRARKDSLRHYAVGAIAYPLRHCASECGWKALPRERAPAHRSSRRPLEVCHAHIGFALINLSFMLLSRSPQVELWPCTQSGAAARGVHAALIPPAHRAALLGQVPRWHGAHSAHSAPAGLPATSRSARPAPVPSAQAPPRPAVDLSQPRLPRKQAHSAATATLSLICALILILAASSLPPRFA